MFDFLKKKNNTITKSKWFYNGIFCIEYLTKYDILITKKFYQKLLESQEKYNELVIKNKNDSIIIKSDDNFVKGISSTQKSIRSDKIIISKDFFDFLIGTYDKYINYQIAIKSQQDRIDRIFEEW